VRFRWDAVAYTAARIGDTKLPTVSLLEPGWYINYQRIEDNLAIVRERCAIAQSLSFPHSPLIMPKVKTSPYVVTHLGQAAPWSMVFIRQ
jgi:hypothetical protein